MLLVCRPSFVSVAMPVRPRGVSANWSVVKLCQADYISNANCFFGISYLFNKIVAKKIFSGGGDRFRGAKSVVQWLKGWP